MYVIEFRRGPDKKKRKKRKAIPGFSKKKAFGTSIAKDVATGLGASAVDAGLAYALIRRRGIVKAKTAKNIAVNRFKRSIPLSVGVSTLTGTYGGVEKVLRNKKENK